MFHFETNKVLGTDFVQCHMNDVTIPSAFVLNKTLKVYYVYMYILKFRDRVIMGA